MTKKFNIPEQPKITETVQGNYEINMGDLNQWYQEMDAAHAQWEQTMQGAEMDPDEITRRMFALFTK